MVELPKTILYPDAWAAAPPADFDGPVYWYWLEGAVNHIRGIKPTDLDATIEINHFSLVVETKNVGAPISRGKTMQLNHMVETGLVSVMAVWGKTSPLECWVKTFNRPWRQISHRNCTEWARRWADWANSQKPNFWRQRMLAAARTIEINPGASRNGQ